MLGRGAWRFIVPKSPRNFRGRIGRPPSDLRRRASLREGHIITKQSDTLLHTLAWPPPAGATRPTAAISQAICNKLPARGATLTPLGTTVHLSQNRLPRQPSRSRCQETEIVALKLTVTTTGHGKRRGRNRDRTLSPGHRHDPGHSTDHDPARIVPARARIRIVSTLGARHDDDARSWCLPMRAAHPTTVSPRRR